MNIFYLDRNPKKCAQWYNERHLQKMITESVQMLSQTFYAIDEEFAKSLQKQGLIYKKTHINHPSTIWVRQSKQHYDWIKQLVVELNKERFYRRPNSRDHASYVKMLNMPDPDLPDNGFVDPPICINPEIDPSVIGITDVVEAYRTNYMNGKRHLAKWKRRKQPKWFR